MSYTRPNTGNSMNDYFTTLMDFRTISPNLLHAETEQSFGVWLDKLIAIDKRATLRLLLQHKNSFPREYLAHVRLRYPEYREEFN